MVLLTGYLLATNSSYTNSSYTNFSDTNSSYTNSSYTNSSYTNSSYTTSSYTNSSYTNTSLPTPYATGYLVVQAVPAVRTVDTVALIVSSVSLPH